MKKWNQPQILFFFYQYFNSLLILLGVKVTSERLITKDNLFLFLQFAKFTYSESITSKIHLIDIELFILAITSKIYNIEIEHFEIDQFDIFNSD